MDGVSCSGRHDKCLVVVVAARPTAAAGIVAAGAAAADHERANRRRVGRGREDVVVRDSAVLVESDAEVVDPVVADARHVATRAAEADAARHKGTHHLVRVDALVVRDFDPVEVGRFGRQALDASGHGADRQAGRERRVAGWLALRHLPDLHVEGAFGRIGGAKRRDRVSKLDVARPRVHHLQVRDRALDNLHLHDRSGRQKRGGVHRVVIRLDAGGTHLARPQTNLVHHTVKATIRSRICEIADDKVEIVDLGNGILIIPQSVVANLTAIVERCRPTLAVIVGVPHDIDLCPSIGGQIVHGPDLPVGVLFSTIAIDA